MQLKVLPVEASDIRELAIAGIEAFQNPLQTLLLAVYPPFENEGAEIEWHIKRLTRDFESQTPPKIWVKVVDADANNKIVGAARWLIYADASPFADRKAANPEEGWSAEKQTGGTAQEPPSLFDFPAGSIEERFATQGYGQIAAGRKQYADRPQIYLISAFTIPSYRRCGVGKLFMEPGVAKADEMGLESWLEASWLGNALYERNGFIPVCTLTADPVMPDGLTEEEKAKWESRRELAKPPVSYTLMWRPKGEEYVEGVTVKPWDAVDC